MTLSRISTFFLVMTRDRRANHNFAVMDMRPEYVRLHVYVLYNSRVRVSTRRRNENHQRGSPRRGLSMMVKSEDVPRDNTNANPRRVTATKR